MENTSFIKKDISNSINPYNVEENKDRIKHNKVCMQLHKLQAKLEVPI